MAIFWPINNNANWTTLSIWASSDGTVSGSAGSFPTINDDVYTNGTNTTLNTDINIGRLSNHRLLLPFGTILSGGSFFVTNATTTVSCNITAFIIGGGDPDLTDATLQITIASPRTCNLFGSASGFTTRVGAHGSAAIRKSGSGLFTMYGNILTQTHAGGLNVASGLLQILGNTTIYGNTIGGTNAFNCWGIDHTGGLLTVIGNISGGGPDRCIGLRSAADTDVVIYGDVVGGNSTGNGAPWGVWKESGEGTIFIFGNIRGGLGGGGTGASAVVNSSNSLIYISGGAIGGSGSNSIGASNTGLGTISIQGDIQAGTGSGGHGLSNSNYGVIYSNTVRSNGWGRGSSGIGGPAYGIVNSSIFGTCYVRRIISGERGMFPTAGVIFTNSDKDNYVSLFSFLSTNENYIPPFLPFNNTAYVSSVSSDRNYAGLFSAITGYNLLFSSLTGGGTIVPAVTNVRLGTPFDFNTKTGTLILPIRQTVARGVPIDNTTGTSITDPSLVWVAPISSFQNQINTLGFKVYNGLTIQEYGNQIIRFR